MNSLSSRLSLGSEDRDHRPRTASLAATLGVSGVLVAAATLGWWSDRSPGPLLTIDLATGSLSWLLTPLMLWRPAATTAVVTVLVAISPAATPPATIGMLQVARHRRALVAVGVAVAGIAAHVVQGAWRPHGGMSYGWWLALVTIGYGALLGWGAWAQAHQALIRSLRERARRAEAEQGRRVAEARMLERRKIAREMHDVLAHRLSLLATFAGAMKYRPDSSPEQLSRAAGVVRDGVHQALDELREVISLLRDDDPPEGAGCRPQPVLADIPRLVEETRDAGTEVLLHEAVDQPSEAPPLVARTAYRVIQEGLTNARKHAVGQPVHVAVRGGPARDWRSKSATHWRRRARHHPDGPEVPGWSGSPSGCTWPVGSSTTKRSTASSGCTHHYHGRRDPAGTCARRRRRRPRPRRAHHDARRRLGHRGGRRGGRRRPSPRRHRRARP